MADSGLYSRSEARTLVRAGRVSVDGETVTAPERKFPREAAVSVDGAAVNCSRYRYFMLDKPAGYVCATEDRSLPTVLELLPAEYRGLWPLSRGPARQGHDGAAASHERRRLRPPRHLAEVEGGKDATSPRRRAGDVGRRLGLCRGPHARGWNTMPAREARAAGGRCAAACAS